MLLPKHLIWSQGGQVVRSWNSIQQPGFDSCLGKTTKKDQKPPSVPLMTASRKPYSKKVRAEKCEE